MDEELHVGLVGCGGMGNHHLKIIPTMPGARLVGVCDYREDRAKRMNTQYSVPYWLDYEQFLDEAKPQVVHICSPSGLHAEHGIAAAQRGIHVLSEKPLDIDLVKVDRLIEACDRYDVRLACIFQRRLSRGAQIVQKAIAEGKMGRILSCSISVKWWRAQSYYDKDAWRGTWALDGGVFANQGIHSLDQMVWMAGPVAEVEYAHLETAMHQMEAEDFGVVAVRFESGARGLIEMTTCCQPDMATRLEIYGTNGSAALDDAKVIQFGLDGNDLLETLEDKGALTGGGSDPWAITLGGHEAQIWDFYQAVIEHRPPIVDGHAARTSVDLLNKIYAKAFPDQKVGL
jgi:predicted dehydrogenase